MGPPAGKSTELNAGKEVSGPQLGFPVGGQPGLAPRLCKQQEGSANTRTWATFAEQLGESKGKPHL